MKHFQIVLLLSMFCSIELNAQNAKPPSRSNSIKMDLTSHIFFSKAFVFSYERVLKPYQTIAVTAGYLQFQPFSNVGSNIVVTDDKSANGLKFGVDYRFYLQKENKHTAPHGVYIGPYFSYLGFHNERMLEIDNNGTSQTAGLTSKIGIVNIGVQLGYQFVIKDRWTIDLVFVGPAVSNYRLKMTLDGNYTGDASDIQNEVVQKLIGRFPALEDLINEKEISAQGKIDSWSFGYRYQLQVGYRFGRKK